MKKIILTLLAMFLLNAGASNAEDFCQPLRLCAIKNISKLDDGISSAPIVSAAVISTCSEETQQCVIVMQENAVKKIPDKLKADGTFDKISAHDIAEIEKIVRSDKNSEQFRETVKNDMLTPMVLQHRVSKKQN